MGTTESLLYDDRPPDDSERPPHRAVVSHPSEQRLPGHLANQSTTPALQPKKPTRPITRLSGVLVGGPKVGKRTLLQRLEGIDPFARDANNTDPLSSVTIAYKPPAGMPTWNRIQLQVEKGKPNTFPKVDFLLILLRLTHEDARQEIQNMIFHALETYLHNLGYNRNDEAKICCAPVCICVLHNFRDLKNEQQVNTSDQALEETLDVFMKTILKQYSIPSDRLVMEFLSTSLRNGYGLDHLHHFIYQTYLQKKREALEAQLRAVAAQISQATQSDIVPYHEFVKQLSSLDHNVSPSNKVESRQSKGVITNEKDAELPSSHRGDDTRSRSNNTQPQQKPSGVTTSNPLRVDTDPRPIASSTERATRSGRRQIYPQATEPIRLDKNALEAFLGGESSDEDRSPRKHRKEKSSKKKVSARVTESSDDDDDDFFYDEKGQFTNRKGYDPDDSSSSSSSSSSSQSRQNVPHAAASNTQKAKTKPDKGTPIVSQPKFENLASEPSNPARRPANVDQGYKERVTDEGPPKKTLEMKTDMTSKTSKGASHSKSDNVATELSDVTRRSPNVEQGDNERDTDEIPPNKMPGMKTDKTLPQSLMQQDQTSTPDTQRTVVAPGKKATQDDDDSEDDEFFIDDSRKSHNTNKNEPDSKTLNERVQSSRTMQLDKNACQEDEPSQIGNRARREGYSNLDDAMKNEEPDISATSRTLETTRPQNMDDSDNEANGNHDSELQSSQNLHEATSEQARASIEDEEVDKVPIKEDIDSSSKGERLDTKVPAATRPGDKPTKDATEPADESSPVFTQNPRVSSQEECYADKWKGSQQSEIQHSPDHSDDEEFFIGEEKNKDLRVVAQPASGSFLRGDNSNCDEVDNDGRNPIWAAHQGENHEEPNDLVTVRADDKTRATTFTTPKTASTPTADDDSDNDGCVVDYETRMIESTQSSSRVSSSADMTTGSSSRTGGDTMTSAPSSSGISAAALAAIHAAQREAEAMLLQSIESDNDNHRKPKKAKKEKKQKKDGGEKKKKKKKDKSSRTETIEEVEASD